MATQYERYGNSAFTYLQTAVSDSVLVIIVYDVRRFPTNANFRIRVGNELMLVTSIDPNLKELTVTRGIEGTLAKPHDLGDLVINVFTQGGLDQTLTDRVLYAKQRPQYGQLSDSNGVKTEVADLTWHSQGPATATDVAGTIWMNGKRGIGTQAHSLLITTPSTPWTYTLGHRPFLSNNSTSPTSFAWSGIALKNTGNARMLTHGVLTQSDAGGSLTTMVQRLNTATSNSSIPKREAWLRRYDDVMWHRVTDNGTNLIYDHSRDGVNWQQFYSVSRTAWLASGPNQVGFFVNPTISALAFGSRMDNYTAFVHASFT